ncbi:MAG: ABC transporter permease [Candidatus Bathyarchaeota archaeon]|nr:ABC transporter permease [Candidatus Bathyarchaeota archaeon]
MSSGAGFPINDLLRRRLQTGLAIITLTLAVASTLFFLLFSSQLGMNISSGTGMFTLGLNAIFRQYLTFIGALIFVVGAVLVSFIVVLMMAQRTRDFGLIKAAGCPNSLAGGYFLTELILTVTAGCIIGTIVGSVADFLAATILFDSYTLANWWYIPLVFGVFFGLALFFGFQPILKATKLTPAEALSPVHYYGLFVTRKYKALSYHALTWRIASRSMARRLNPIIRIVILLSVVFVLLTVSVAGGLIASDTTLSWVQKTEEGTIAVAYYGMGTQYRQLLGSFSGERSGDFNYSNTDLGIPTSASTALMSLPGVSSVQERLVIYENVTEIGNFTVIDGQMISVGGDRTGNSIIIGVSPSDISVDFANKGLSLRTNGAFEAVISDSIAQTMYSTDKNLNINYADPIVESIEIKGRSFQIVGLCVDPLNNGYVTYVPIEKLMNVSGLSRPNLLLVTLDGSVDRTAAIEEIRNTIKSVDPGLEAFDFSQISQKNTALLTSTWETIMLIPLFSVASAAICLVAYMMLSIDEQRQEFAMMRAVGARPKLVVRVSAIESALVLLSSLGVGLSFGIITTILILMTNPIVTATTIATIAAWLIAALLAMFVLSLYPAIKLSKTEILKIYS